MITNILATIVIAITTNTYAPKQYLDTSYGCLVNGCTQDHSYWRDTPAYGWKGESQTRDNPNIRIIEIHEVRSYQFEIEGNPYTIVAEDKLLSKTTKRRKIQQKVTSTNDVTMTATIEYWEVDN